VLEFLSDAMPEQKKKPPDESSGLFETQLDLIRSGWPVRQARLPNKEWSSDIHKWRADRDPSCFDGSATA